MKLARTALAFVAALALCGAWTSASAALMTLGFSGTLTSSLGSLNAGDPYSATYTFDPAIAARSGSTSSFAFFDDLASVNLTIGSFIASVGPGTGLSEIQQDNVANADRYALVGRNAVGSAPIGGFNIFVIGFTLNDTTGTAITDARTLLTAPSLANFTGATFLAFFGTIQDLHVVTGTVTSLQAVPEPSTTAALVAALLAASLVLLRRRARARHGRR